MLKERFQEEFLFKVTNNTKKSTKNEEFSESCAKVFLPPRVDQVFAQSRVFWCGLFVVFICVQLRVEIIVCFIVCETSTHSSTSTSPSDSGRFQCVGCTHNTFSIKN